LIFLDTNVLLYACGIHGEEDVRTAKALEIVSSNQRIAISMQVIQEFFDNAIRPKRPRHLTVDEAIGFVTQWRQFEVVPTTLNIFDDAVAIRQRYKFRYWDCAILAAAGSIGCHTVLSEDMQHGQKIGDITIINPF
jgi:predicted nucleic acid-binding protein